MTTEVPRLGPGALTQTGPKARTVTAERAPWERWRGRDEARRVIRFAERLRLPDTGELAELADFQRQIVRATYSSLFTVASLPAGNGKTSLMALMGLERICRGDPYVPVVVLATKKDQAREVVEAAKAIAECDPLLVDRVSWYESDGELVYRPTMSRLTAHSARLKSIEGLRYRLALIDEIGFAADELVTSIIARLGKGSKRNHVLGMGTPGFEPNVLHRLRGMAADGELPSAARYLEWSAPDGCALDDYQAWLDANPAASAGFLSRETWELQRSLMPEPAFRVYHLAQWVKGTEGWLPTGVWASCPHAEPPEEGSSVVLAVAGTPRRTAAVVGATPDGAVFLVWAADLASDDEIHDVIAEACDRWHVTGIVHGTRVRPQLYKDLFNLGFPMVPWAATPEVGAASANELYRAICDGRLAHDHHPLLEAHMIAQRAGRSTDGSLRLKPSDSDDEPCDAAIAARMAWWTAIADDEPGPMFVRPTVAYG